MPVPNRRVSAPCRRKRDKCAGREKSAAKNEPRDRNTEDIRRRFRRVRCLRKSRRGRFARCRRKPRPQLPPSTRRPLPPRFRPPIRHPPPCPPLRARFPSSRASFPRFCWPADCRDSPRAISWPCRTSGTARSTAPRPPASRATNTCRHCASASIRTGVWAAAARFSAAYRGCATSPSGEVAPDPDFPELVCFP